MADLSLIFVCGVGCGTWIYDDLASGLPKGIEVSRATVVELAGPASGGDHIVQRATDGLRNRIASARKRTIVIAHSLGGALALAVAEKAPSNLAGLVLIDAGPRWTQPPQRFDEELQIDREVGRMLPSASRRLVDQHLRDWISDMVSAPADRERLLADFRSNPVPVLREVLAEGRKLQLRIDPGRLRVPMLVIAACSGETDRRPTLAEFRERYAGAADVTIVPVCGARHFAMLDQPLQVRAAMAGFVQAAPRASPAPAEAS